MRFLLLVFIVVPVVEMWLLIQIGGLIGAWPTIGLVFLTAIAGLALLRREGLKTLMRGSRRLEEGELPAGEVLEGLILAVSGALLLTPGFATDIAGFLGLLPLSRRFMVKKLLSSRYVNARFHRGPGAYRSRSDSRRTIEAEYWREKDNGIDP